MSKRSMQKKLALLQQKWDGDNLEDQNSPDTGDWSPENIAKNREAYIKEQNPWIAYGMTCSEWYEKIIKPKMKTQEAQAA
jgi:hypothetical protein